MPVVADPSARGEQGWMSFLGHVTIATQLMLLVTIVAGLAIVLASYFTSSAGRKLFEERVQNSLANESQLRGYALREAVRRLVNHIRNLEETLVDRLPKQASPQPFHYQAYLREVLTGELERGEEVDGRVIVEACLIEIQNRDKVRTLAVMDRETLRLVEGRAEAPSNRAVRDIWEGLGKEPDMTSRLRARLSQLRPIPRGDDDTFTYYLAIGCPLRQGIPSPRPAAFGATEPMRMLILTVDFTRLVAYQARRLPRQLLFVHDVYNNWVYHPDPKQIGRSQDTWGLLASESEGSETHELEGRSLPELRYYTLREKLPSAITNSVHEQRMLEEELDLPGLRFSQLHRGESNLALSSPDRDVLDKARERLLQREALSEGLSDTAQWRARRAQEAPVLCQTFIGYHVPRMELAAEGPVSVGLILAAAQEELSEVIESVTTRLWLRIFIPVLFASAILALGLAYVLIRPLRRLNEAAQRLSRGDYSYNVQVSAPGEVGELARSFHEMTDKIQKRERELRESLARYNTILTNAADGIITFDQTGRIEQANEAAEEMFGYKKGQLEGQKVQKLMKLPAHLYPGQSPRGPFDPTGASATNPGGGTVTALTNAVKTPGEEHKGVRRDGSTFWMEITFSQVPLEARRLITGIFRDVTKRKAVEERVRQMNDELDARVHLRTAQLEDSRAKLELALAQAESANLAKDRFISVVSHELRTPLTSAMGYTDLLLNPRATKLRDNPTPTLERIQTSCKHLLTLINDLLDVGRYTAGKPIDLAPTSFDLNNFLRGVVEMVAPLVKKNANVMEKQIQPDLGEVFNDETRLRQILLNLLSNASKFTEKGKVTLQVSRHKGEGGDRIVMNVSDTGSGLTEQQVENLFTPFYRVDNSMTRRQGGTGLGLTITRMICELMGGTIKVQSAPGQGSTFTVDLPAHIPTQGPQPEQRTQEPLSEGVREGRGLVLVIDDDTGIRQMLQTYLQQEGFSVVEASNGEKGLQLARELRPLCITLDVLMPGQDGWSVLAALKSDPATSDIPVIMLTIFEDRNRGFTLGATDFLTKPIDWGRLAAILFKHDKARSGPILIVDDDHMMRGCLREELTMGGWTVLEAGNGQEALDLCDKATPALILLDLMMPVMDGFAFLEHLRRRENGAAIPVVVLTARELNPEEHKRLNRSVAAVLGKESLTKEALMTRVREQIEGNSVAEQTRNAPKKVEGSVPV